MDGFKLTDVIKYAFSLPQKRLPVSRMSDDLSLIRGHLEKHGALFGQKSLDELGDSENTYNNFTLGGKPFTLHSNLYLGVELHYRSAMDAELIKPIIAQLELPDSSKIIDAPSCAKVTAALKPKGKGR